MNETDKNFPRLVPDADFPRSILKQIHRGRSPSSIKLKGEPIDHQKVISTLIDLGLVDHLELAAIDKPRSGFYFLTDKGVRWLRTHDRWEYIKHELSQWQRLEGIIIGVAIGLFVNYITSQFFPSW